MRLAPVSEAHRSSTRARGRSTPEREPPRPTFTLPVAIRCGAALVEGYVERLTGTDLLVRALQEIPALSGDCALTFELPGEAVTARGSVLSVATDTRTVSVALTALGNGGPSLLAATLLVDDPAFRETRRAAATLRIC